VDMGSRLKFYHGINLKKTLSALYKESVRTAL